MGYMKKALTVFLAVFCLMNLTACGKKEAISLDEFNTGMEAEGYTIIDATGQIAPEQITAISLALKDDYQIEFYVFTDGDTAASTYEQNKYIFEEYKSSGHVEVYKNIGNYSYYALTSDGIYYLLSRVDNTMIYVVADAEYKSEINAMVKKFGY